VIRKLVKEILEEDWREVEIIGWLYQFYISEKKGEVIGKVVKSEDIPAATQLFTPNWIVKYMVQNTLGRQWMATYPNSSLKQQMDFYIEPAEQTPEVQEQLKAITPDSFNPEELTLLDPACGSGHILVEAYDLLKTIYQERGYRAKDIPRLILEKNLYGLEIDDRAAQLAAFALMMKARADDRHIFENGTQPHVLAIQESKGLDAGKMTEALNEPILKVELPPREFLFEEMEEERAPLFSRKNLSVKGDIRLADVAQLIDLFEQGKTFGSLIRIPEELARKLPEIMERVKDVLAYGDMFGKAVAQAMMPIVNQAQMLARKYDAVVTNPPYMGSKGMNGTLKAFAQANYPDSKSDLFAMFIERNLELVSSNGAVAMITMQSWMFLSSFERLRARLFTQSTILSMAHLGTRGFDSIGGEVVSTTAFVIENSHRSDYKGGYLRLVDGNSEAEKQAATLEAIKNPNCGWFYRASAANFKKIPGSPIAYWAKEKAIAAFEHDAVEDHFVAKKGMAIGDNARFLRLWNEVSLAKIKWDARGKDDTHNYQWYPCLHGGSFKKWSSNKKYVVNWKNDGNEPKSAITEKTGDHWSRYIISTGFFFSPGINWTAISSSSYSARYHQNGFAFTSASMGAFSEESDPKMLLLLMNSVVGRYFLSILSPTLNYGIAELKKIPYGLTTAGNRLDEIVDTLIKVASNDWDSYETSWGYTELPLLGVRSGKCDSRLEDADPNQKSAIKNQELSSVYACVGEHWRAMTQEMQQLEGENNRIFIEAYGLQDELMPDVPLNEITLTCNPHYRYGGDKSEEELEELLLSDTMRELISYAIGCMMGRYSLDKPGLIYAHSGNERFWEIYHEKHEKAAGDHNENNSCDSWSSFPPDQDGIIPITDTDWFPDDAANRVVDFIAVAWPREHLKENLKFVAESLGPKRGESPRNTLRRYLATGFYKHHLSMYKKRPIYWLFSSGKQRAFQCLVYLHRYNEGTLSRMRTEYVIPLQGKINARIEQLKNDIHAATSTPHRKKLEKERAKLVKQQAELQTFDEKLRHYADKRISLDLDNGVKVNYDKFGDLLAEVKAITGKKRK
jgi:type II restriction/modification system DNA methylase subunit YeeA